MDMLEINDLKFSIEKLNILQGINLKVPKGQTLGVIGPNGSGKTTLFNCLSGFNTNLDGTIFFKEKNITKMPAHKRAKNGIGRVFQNFGIFREMSVLENILIALESKQSFLKNITPFSKQNKENVSLAMEYLAKIRLAEKYKQKAASLSGGQMRLLEIIRTLAFGADLLLLDEPTAGVSPKMKEDISELIKELQKQDKTILIIEHDINFIQNFCHRIVVLDLGLVALDGTPEFVRNNERLKEIYFGKNS